MPLSAENHKLLHAVQAREHADPGRPVYARDLVAGLPGARVGVIARQLGRLAMSGHLRRSRDPQGVFAYLITELGDTELHRPRRPPAPLADAIRAMIAAD